MGTDSTCPRLGSLRDKQSRVDTWRAGDRARQLGHRQNMSVLVTGPLVTGNYGAVFTWD